MALGHLRFALFFALGLAIAPLAHAQDPAAALLEEGRSLRASGDNPAALDRFTRAFEMSRSAEARAQMALALAAVGRWVDGHVHMSAALETNDPWVRRNREALQGALRTMESRTALINITCNVEGAELLVDNTSRGTFPLSAPVRVMTGDIAIEVRAPGHRPATMTIAVEGGARLERSVQLERTPDEAPPTEELDPNWHRRRAAPPVEAPREQESGGLMWTFVAGGATVAFGALAMIGGVNVLGQNSELNSKCRDGNMPSCTRERIDMITTPGWYTATTIGLIGTAVAAAATVTLFILESGSSSESAPTDTRARLEVGPGSLRLSGVF